MAGAGVSVLVATYNGAPYIREQLDSILSQIAADDEIIVADDGSSDGTRGILERYRIAYPQMTLTHNTRNLGVRGTFEKLLGLATRDIVFLSDQDDIWLEYRKERMLRALDTDGCVAVLANAQIMTDRGVERTFFPATHDPDVRSIIANYVRNSFIGCCMAFRRDVLDLALPFPPTISMHDWWLGTCAMATGQVRYLSTPSLLYRRHGANLSPGIRRPLRTVLRDRAGNLLALATLAHRSIR